MNKKNKRLIGNLIKYIYRDNIYLVNPQITWCEINVFDKSVVKNYDLIRPTLLQWKDQGFIELIENNVYILRFDPDKLPIQEDLFNFLTENS